MNDDEPELWKSLHFHQNILNKRVNLKYFSKILSNMKTNFPSVSSEGQHEIVKTSDEHGGSHNQAFE